MKHERAGSKTIGLIGGMSWESSAEYYRIINQESKRRLGGHHNAKSVMVTVDFGEIEDLQHRGQWEQLGEKMTEAAKQVHAAGAKFIVLCTNTMHKLAHAIESAVPIPLLHIADATGERIRSAGISKVGLLGTRFTMEQDFYREQLENKFGIDVLIPTERERTEVHRVIYDKLCHGRIMDSSRELYKDIIAAFKKNGAEAVILGCTEITLLIGGNDSSLPIFDTTRIHAEAAVEAAIPSAHLAAQTES